VLAILKFTARQKYLSILPLYSTGDPLLLMKQSEQRMCSKGHPLLFY